MTNTKNKTIEAILFWISIVSAIILLLVSVVISFVKYATANGAVNYSWVVLPVALFGVALSVYSVINRKQGVRLARNITVGIIVTVIYVFYGMMFKIAPMDTTRTTLNAAEKIIDCEIPQNVNVVSNLVLHTSFAKLTDDQEKEQFESQLKSNIKFVDKLSQDVQHSLPASYVSTIKHCNYVMFYDNTHQIYNSFNGNYFDIEFLLVGYNSVNGQLILLGNYKFY